MKKKRLEIDYSYDFYLVGITSSARGFKLAWDINQALGTRLVKQHDLAIHFRDETVGEFMHYLSESSINNVRLFRNKSNDDEGGKVSFLVPEFPHHDFIIFVQGDDMMDSNRLQEYLRTIPSVQWVAFIPLDALKSKDYFIF